MLPKARDLTGGEAPAEAEEGFDWNSRVCNPAALARAACTVSHVQKASMPFNKCKRRAAATCK